MYLLQTLREESQNVPCRTQVYVQNNSLFEHKSSPIVLEETFYGSSSVSVTINT